MTKITYIFAVCHLEDDPSRRLEGVRVRFYRVDIRTGRDIEFLGERYTNPNGEAILGNIDTGPYGWIVRAYAHDPKGRVQDAWRMDLCVGPQTIIWIPMPPVPEHSTKISLIETRGLPVVEGGLFEVRVWVLCTLLGCDLRGKRVEILRTPSGDGSLAAGAELVNWSTAAPYYGQNWTSWFPVIAPKLVGKYTWTAKFPRQSPHAESHKIIEVRTRG